MLDFIKDIPTIYLGLIGSFIAGMGTGVGAIPVLVIRKISQRVQGAMLGFGAGVMLAATSFSLVIPSLEAATLQTNSNTFSALIVVIGILLGGLFLWCSHQYFPHEHFIKGPEGNYQNLKRTWLFVIAIAIHNFPEGLAVGVGFGGEYVANGIALAVGIGLQNIPEGFVVAIALLTEKYSRWSAFSVALLTGLVEPLGGLIGAGVVSISQAILPWAMAFAAGAMLFVISDEIIPESHSLGHEKEATIGVMVGFVIMMFLDFTLG
ncbi:ZIP family metal transporter [Limnoraphis robusta Tam1]|uniref:ZIP family metal transporter n=1 Tax=Limnoraphis robusta CCNP1315 TaxID=3110306 RepID=A0ABU5TS47_9CYAN|nr:ZIP family metal transporter [Limnoraphis robusta]MEA5517732.1 ZIP family metal transporter [Limnoraphis robusta CCNP1315]MEA5540797.1 ZIP family metal transporter [Limnoraphis robusta Tam1]MEA5546283.1 ZIP family metal transporter [Limnoraphis robusta CCNP1324]